MKKHLKYIITMKRSGILLLLVLLVCSSKAQTFITKGKIEYEVKQNLRGMYGIAIGNFGSSDEPAQFNTFKEVLTFSGNRWLYEPGESDDEMMSYFSNTGGTAYVDYDKKEAIIRRSLLGEGYLYSDTVQKIRWKIDQEMRTIAGWKCRKAIGVVDDSVYVVAFYSPEIIPQGGPELFSGLPGMILGLAIPRESTTWFATKVEVLKPDESKIVPPTLKNVKLLTKGELDEQLNKQFGKKEITAWVKQFMSIKGIRRFLL